MPATTQLPVLSMPSCTYANLPTPTGSYQIMSVTDIGVNGSRWVDKGTWVCLDAKITISYPCLEQGILFAYTNSSGAGSWSISQSGYTVTVVCNGASGIPVSVNGSWVYLTGSVATTQGSPYWGYFSNLTYVSSTTFTCTSTVSATVGSYTMLSSSSNVAYLFPQPAYQTFLSGPYMWASSGTGTPLFKKLIFDIRQVSNATSSTKIVGFGNSASQASAKMLTTSAFQHVSYDANLLPGGYLSYPPSSFVGVASATQETVNTNTWASAMAGAPNGSIVMSLSAAYSWQLVKASIYLVPF